MESKKTEKSSNKNSPDVEENMPKSAKELITVFSETLSDSSDNEIRSEEIATITIEKTPKKKRKSQNDVDDASSNTSNKKRYVQKYVKDWEKVPAFKQWVSESLLGNTYFYCKFCKSDNRCGKTELEKHMVSRKHTKNATQPTVKVQRKFKFRGLLCPVFTPFTSSGDVNYEMIPKYANYLQKCGVRGILVNDVVGEGMSLTFNERVLLLEKWINHCGENSLTVMVQIGGAPLKEVKEMAKHAEKKKVDAIVVLPDVYNSPENHYDLMRYIKTVSSAANSVPLLYHHFPKYTRLNIDMTQFLNDMIGEIDSFVGIIYSSNDFKEAAAALAVNEDKYTVFMGADEFILGSCALGFNSIMSASLNFATKFVQSIKNSVKEGNINSAKLTQKYLTDIMDLILIQGQRLPALKCAMNILTPINIGPAREPLVNIWEDKVKKMQKDLSSLINLSTGNV